MICFPEAYFNLFRFISINKFIETLYLIFDYPYKYYTFKLFEV